VVNFLGGNLFATGATVAIFQCAYTGHPDREIMTDEEIMKNLGISKSEYSYRMTKMKSLGLVENSKKKYIAFTGLSNFVYDFIRTLQTSIINHNRLKALDTTINDTQILR
jgi:DNA-binding transcriptional regulator GbsR (MarR family)